MTSPIPLTDAAKAQMVLNEVVDIANKLRDYLDDFKFDTRSPDVRRANLLCHAALRCYVERSEKALQPTEKEQQQIDAIVKAIRKHT